MRFCQLVQQVLGAGILWSALGDHGEEGRPLPVPEGLRPISADIAVALAGDFHYASNPKKEESAMVADFSNNMNALWASASNLQAQGT